MRKHVTPADPAATILDLDRGDALPPEGRAVNWTPHWAGLKTRGEIVVTEIQEATGEPGAHPPAEPTGA